MTDKNQKKISHAVNGLKSNFKLLEFEIHDPKNSIKEIQEVFADFKTSFEKYLSDIAEANQNK